MKKNKKIWSWALAGALAVSNLSVVVAPVTGMTAFAAINPNCTDASDGNGAIITDSNIGGKLLWRWSGVATQKLNIGVAAGATSATAIVCTPTELAAGLANDATSTSGGTAIATVAAGAGSSYDLTPVDEGTVCLVVGTQGTGAGQLSSAANSEYVEIEITKDTIEFSNFTTPDDVSIHGGESKQVEVSALEKGVDIDSLAGKGAIYKWTTKPGSKLTIDDNTIYNPTIYAPAEVTGSSTEEVGVEVVKYGQQYAWKSTGTFEVTLLPNRKTEMSVDADDLEESGTAGTDYDLELVEGTSDTKEISVALTSEDDEDYDPSDVKWSWTLGASPDIDLLDDKGVVVSGRTGTKSDVLSTSISVKANGTNWSTLATKAPLTITATSKDGSKTYATKKVDIYAVGKELVISGVYADGVTEIDTLIGGDDVKKSGTLTAEGGTGTHTWSLSSGGVSVFTLGGSTTKTETITYAGAGIDTVKLVDGKGREGELTLRALSGPEKAVDKVELNKTELNIDPNESQTITATVSPTSAEIKSVTWESSDPETVSVTNGTIKGLKAGTATITVTADDTTNGVKTATAEVTVNGISSVTVSGENEVLVGKEITLNKEVSTIGKLAAEGTETTKWEITDAVDADGYAAGLTAIAKINDNGVLTGVAEGKVKLVAKVTIKNTSTHVYKFTSEEFEVAVLPTTTSLEVNKDDIEIVGLGKTETIEYTVLPADQKVEFASDNEKIATVDDKGVVTAVAAGTTKITLKSGDFTRTVSVTVSLSDEDKIAEAIAAANAAADAAVATPSDATIQAAKDAVAAAEKAGATPEQLKDANDKIAAAEAAKAKADEDAKKAEEQKKQEEQKKSDGSEAGKPAPVNNELKDTNGNPTGFFVTNATAGSAEVEYRGTEADKKKTDVTIPDTIKDASGNEYKVTGIAANAFKDSEVKTVTIGKNIKSIDKNAFKDSKVKTVKIKGTKLSKKMAKNLVKSLKKGAKIKVSGKNKKKNRELLKKQSKVKSGKIKVK